ncbi:hypothetical protein B0H10DRAFT_2216782 [Mycena sp. CBHHK59/15]|nr:hypothetical protein B0H10DRAFT_2216782 [Mycena sp. CBHHK59/15]
MAHLHPPQRGGPSLAKCAGACTSLAPHFASRTSQITQRTYARISAAQLAFWPRCLRHPTPAPSLARDRARLTDAKASRSVTSRQLNMTLASETNEHSMRAHGRNPQPFRLLFRVPVASSASLNARIAVNVGTTGCGLDEAPSDGERVDPDKVLED